MRNNERKKGAGKPAKKSRGRETSWKENTGRRIFARHKKTKAQKPAAPQASAPTMAAVPKRDYGKPLRVKPVAKKQSSASPSDVVNRRKSR